MAVVNLPGRTEGKMRDSRSEEEELDSVDLRE